VREATRHLQGGGEDHRRGLVRWDFNDLDSEGLRICFAQIKKKVGSH
jgi:hypothetical protein